MAAAMTHIEELELTEAEGKKVSEAIGRVNEYYGGFAIPENIAVWGNFTFAMLTVYGPRVLVMKRRMAAEEAARGPGTIDAVNPIRVQ